MTPLNSRRLAALMALYEAYAERMHLGLDGADGELPVHLELDVEALAEGDGECILCGQRRLKNSEFCLDCQTRLHQEFGEAAKHVHGNIGRHPVESANIRGLISEMAEHRSKVYHTRTNPYPMGKLRSE